MIIHNKRCMLAAINIFCHSAIIYNMQIKYDFLRLLIILFMFLMFIDNLSCFTEETK